jgi:hypothetical protein
MTNMFTSYDNEALGIPCRPRQHCEPQRGAKLLTNIKGELLGVQIDYNIPMQLYFHLENTCDCDIAELLAGTTVFEILTTTHKSAFECEYKTAEILDQYTNDLCISLSIEEVQTLRKETYNMKVTLKTATGDIVVFAEKDGYLVIR